MDAPADRVDFRCSGAADVGEIAKSRKKLNRDGVGACLHGRDKRTISCILKTSEAAESILAFDGCPLNCVKSAWSRRDSATSGICNWRIWAWRNAKAGPKEASISQDRKFCSIKEGAHDRSGS